MTFLNLYNRFDMVGHEKEIDSRMVREGDAGHVGPNSTAAKGYDCAFCDKSTNIGKLVVLYI